MQFLWQNHQKNRLKNEKFVFFYFWNSISFSPYMTNSRSNLGATDIVLSPALVFLTLFSFGPVLGS